jgi:hypothetical protein
MWCRRRRFRRPGCAEKLAALDMKNVQNRAMLLTTEKIRALVDNIGGKKDRVIEGEVVKKDDDDG